MMPAAKHLDPVLGIDIHLIQPPGPVPPLPIPHPFIGIVMDPFDYVPFLGATILVNGMPRAIAGTAGIAVPPHIPLGGVFVKPPGNECEMFMGSATVAFDGDAASHMLHPALSCHTIGMVPPFRANPKKKTKLKSMVLPTSVVLPIPMGMPVLIGGPPTISLSALGMRAGMSALGKGFKKLRKVMKNSKRMKRLSNKLHKAADKTMDKLGVPKNARLRNKTHRKICTLTGHPVDVATGKMVTEAVDLQLGMGSPFLFERVWYSSSVYQGPLGHGWHHNHDSALLVEERWVAHRTSDGRAVVFPMVGMNEQAHLPAEQLTLGRDGAGFFVKNAAGETTGYASCNRPNGELAPKWTLFEADRVLHFQYDARGRMIQARDQGNRTLRFTYNEENRITAIFAPHPENPDEEIAPVSYIYNERGDLTEVWDADFKPFRYHYQDHLIVRETNRNGFSFFFEYDQPGNEAQCVATWGDGNLYRRQLTYDNPARMTKVVDSLNDTATYLWNEDGLVTRVYDARGRGIERRYDDLKRLLSETDPYGNSTQYAYDARGNVTKLTEPDGLVHQACFDARGHLITKTAPGEASVRYSYDIQGRMIRQSRDQGPEYRYEYDHRNRLCRIIDNQDAVTHFYYDERGNLVRHIQPGNRETRYVYNAWGAIQRRTDPDGTCTTYTFDTRGNLTTVQCEGKVVLRLAYDAASNLVREENDRGEVHGTAYTPFNKPLAETNPLGETHGFEYDTEAQLTAVVNPAGERYTFTYDASGKVLETRNFQGVVRKYGYGFSDHVTLLEEIGVATGWDGDGKPVRDHARFKFARDPAGRVLTLDLPDGTRYSYGYDEGGRLARAETPSYRLAFLYDGGGNLVESDQNGQIVRYEYDQADRLITRHAPSGARVSYHYLFENLLSSVQVTTSAAQIHRIRYAYDRDWFSKKTYFPNACEAVHQGSETEPVTQHFEGRDFSQRRTFDAQPEDRAITVSDSRFGSRTYQLDELGRPIQTQRGFGLETMSLDQNGNFLHIGAAGYRTASGNRLATRNGLPYRYNGFGDVVERPGDTPETASLMHYDPLHQLTAVCDRRGQTLATYEYDALGRRVKKVTPENAFTYLWDDCDLLAEISATQTREFVIVDHQPLVEMIAGDAYFYHLDHTGTPTLITDTNGQSVWRGWFGEYGEALLSEGELSPAFGLPGMFVDEETGLGYALWRYYDTRDRRFLTPDPIGLDGGFHAYAYVDNPFVEIDPYGLAKMPRQLKSKYGVHPLSKRALNHRVRLKGTAKSTTKGQCVAVFEYVTPTGRKMYKVATSTFGGKHAEKNAFAALPQYVKNDTSRIKRVYTELEPCDYAGCGKFLQQNAPNATVTYHFKYNPKGPTRTAGKKLHSKTVAPYC